MNARPVPKAKRPAPHHGPRPKLGGKGVAVAAISVAVLAYLGIAPRLRQSHALAAEVRATRETLPLVSVTTVATTPGGAAATLPSNIQAIDQSVVNARASGYVSQVLVDIGSRVTKGQTLAVVQSPEVDQQVSQSEADLAKSRAGVGQAAADEDKMRAAISTAQANQTQAESQATQAQAELEHTVASATRASSAVSVARAKVSEAQQRLAGARADESRAKTEATLAKKTLDRWRQLEKADAVSGQEADEKESDYDSSRAKVEGAAAAVSSAEADVDAAQEAVRGAEADARAARADVDSARGRVRAARAAIDASRSNVMAARSNLDASRSSAQAAQATVASSEAGLRRVAAAQGFERLTAPFSGVITARNVDVGDLVSPAPGTSGVSDPNNAVARTGLFGLARTDVLRAIVDVPEAQAGSVHEGQEASIAVQELPGKVFHGGVFRESGALDASSRTLRVEVRIPNADGALKPGMYGSVSFAGAASRSSPGIPANALIFDGKGTRVATVSADGTLHFISVTVGRDMGDTIEIASGLKGGERVVTNPDATLKDGDRVRVAQ